MGNIIHKWKTQDSFHSSQEHILANAPQCNAQQRVESQILKDLGLQSYIWTNHKTSGTKVEILGHNSQHLVWQKPHTTWHKHLIPTVNASVYKRILESNERSSVQKLNLIMQQDNDSKNSILQNDIRVW